PYCTSWRDSPVKGCLTAIAWRRRLAPPLTGAPPGRGKVAKPGKQKSHSKMVYYPGIFNQKW
ncbi:MAG: hypothetical protein QMD10_12310, partial [Desulfitobacteriaceae bacterium]|nr:hypothetical protein [Desulfitobacteriaceae bacterium]